TGGLGALAAGLRLTTTSGRIFTQAGIEAAGNTTGGFATRALTGGNPFDVRAITVDALAGGLGGGAGGTATVTNALRGRRSARSSTPTSPRRPSSTPTRPVPASPGRRTPAPATT
ncbi:MAG TPA: hypothetical protein VIL36_14690, partial [Acidimicrobiales bacterium]